MQVTNARFRTRYYRTAERSSDPVLGLAVLSIAERWAEMMEPRLEAGETIAAIAEETFQVAATTGADALAPGTQWGDVIADYFEGCWRHGKAFRRWYKSRR